MAIRLPGSQWLFWGIQGPGVPGRGEWRTDHSLVSFRHFWAAETRRRSVRGPEVIERYPYLAGGKPERLPGIDELSRLAENAVIVSTADPFHRDCRKRPRSDIHRYRRTVPAAEADVGCRSVDRMEGGVTRAPARSHYATDTIGRWCTMIKGLHSNEVLARDRIMERT